MSYRGSHRMPLRQRVWLWVYTFSLRDGARIGMYISGSFLVTLALLWLLTGHI